jgi:hypothetical protein
MTEFVKIKGSYYQLDHIIAVKRVKTFKDAAGKSIRYVVRLSEEAAGGEDPRFRNKWCTKAEVEPFLRKMKGLPEQIDDEEAEELPATAVSIGDSTELR